MKVIHSKDIPAAEVKAGTATTRQVLISDTEGPNFAMRKFIMQTGGGMPRHTNSVEHEQYVLRGKARIGIAEQEFEVSEGDVVLIPANVPHWYTNIGEGTFEFLCLIPNQDDVITVLPKEEGC